MLRSKSGALRSAIAACCIALALSGCGGGSVSVRSNFSGAGAPAPAVVPGKAPPGLTAHYAGSGNVGLAILGIVIVADFVQWTTLMLKQALGTQASQPEVADSAPLITLPKKCVYPVPEMC